MKNILNSSRQAFSLVEMAIILIITGIIITGVIQGKKMVNSSKLSNAQIMTQNSKLAEMEGLIAWYETSLESSFQDSERKDGSSISIWNDNNTNASTKNNTTQSTTANKPKFYEKVFNDAIPGIRFDGTNDFLNFNGSDLLRTSYTIFIVEQRRSSAAPQPLIGATGNQENKNIFVGYSTNTKLNYSQCKINTGHCEDDNSISFNVSGYTSPPVANLHTVMLNTSTGKKYWLNGADNPSATDLAQTDTLTELTNLTLGRYSGNNGSSYSFFNGDIGEIIIFKRALKNDERKVIEDYLKKKFGI